MPWLILVNVILHSGLYARCTQFARRVWQFTLEIRFYHNILQTCVDRCHNPDKRCNIGFMKFTHECGGYSLPFFAIAHRYASNPRRRDPVIWTWCVISKRRIDKSHLKCFFEEHEIYCIFIYPDIWMTSTLENFSHERQVLMYTASSIP